MAEFKLGRIRFVWKDEWTSSTTYVKDDVVRFGGRIYLCQVGHISNPDFNVDLDLIPSKWNLVADGQRWRDQWTTNSQYQIGDIVKYGGNIYICIEYHTSASTIDLGLEANLASWNLYVSGLDWKGIWTVSTRYKENDIVRYGGINYICITPHISASTGNLGLEDDQANWQVFSQGQEYQETWLPSTRYKLNDIVKYGAGLWICLTPHQSSLNFETDVGNWDQFVEGLIFQSNWNSAINYKPGDIVRYGGNNYVAKTLNVDKNPLIETADWNLFLEGLKFQAEWDNSVSYKIGEIVKLNGNNYLAITDSPSINYTITSTNSTNNRFATASTQGMIPDQSIRFTGTTFGGVFDGGRYYIKDIVNLTEFTISTTIGGPTFITPTSSGIMIATASVEPPNNSVWIEISNGLYWRGPWEDDVEYNLGDVVSLNSNSYVCILQHRSEADDGSTLGPEGGGQSSSRPDQDLNGVYWNILATGNEISVLTTPGDLVYFGGTGPTRLPVGTEGQILRVSAEGIPEWVTWGRVDHVYYVSPEGEDRPYPECGSSLDKPWKTIRYACEQVEKGPRNPNASYLLELNRAFIQREITAWIRFQTDNNLAPFVNLSVVTITSNNTLETSTEHGLTAGRKIRAMNSSNGIIEQTDYYVLSAGLTDTQFRLSLTPTGPSINTLTDGTGLNINLKFIYNEFKCERDVGFIIDRIIWDLRHGGNLKVRAAAQSFIGALGELGEFSEITENQVYNELSTESEVGVAAYQYFLEVVDSVLDNRPPTVVYQNIFNDSTAIAEQFISTNVVSESGTYSTIEDLVNIVINTLEDKNSSRIPERIVPNNTINLKTGRYRETLPIIVPVETALVGDEKRSVNAGPAGSLISRDDVKYSVEALGRLESFIGQIVLGSTVSESPGNTQAQSQEWPFADGNEASIVTKLIRAIQHQIDWKVGTLILENSEDPVDYNTAYLTGFGDARKLLKENKEFLKDEIIAFISINYPDLLYSRTNCRRDVGYIVDALSYDLTYDGSWATLIAGLAYFDGANGEQLMIDDTEIAATVASYSRLRTVIQQIIANTIVTKSNGNSSTQWTDSVNLTGGSSAVAKVGGLIDIIIDIIQGDSTRSLTPQINVTQVATNDTFTSNGHGLQVGDAVIPRQTANGLVKGTKYWVSVRSTNTFELSSTYGGASITSFTNGSGLDIDLEIIDYPEAVDGVTSTTSLITAAQTLDAAQEAIVENVIDQLNAEAWHTDFVVYPNNLTNVDFEIYVGKHTLVHTYVAGGQVTKSDGSSLSITNFVYDNNTGYAVVTTGSNHGLEAGDIVDVEDILVSCTSGPTTSTAIFPGPTGTLNGVNKVFYIQHKCIRDVRIILESVMFDFMFNSNFQTIKSAYSYLRSSAADVFTGGQKRITRDSLIIAKNSALANVGGDSTAQSRITALMQILDDILFGATNEGSICQTEERNADWARLQIERNREFIVAEIDAWIDDEYVTEVTQATASTDIFTCVDTSWMQRNAAVRFVGTTFGPISENVTYYIQNVVSPTQFKISAQRNSNIPLDVISNVSGSMDVKLFYNSDLCLRDVNRYLDAIKFDLQYPGNYESRLSARYYSNAVTGSLEEDMYYLRNGTGIRNQTLDGLNGDLLPPNEYGTSRVSAGAYCSLDPGWGPDDFRTWIIRRSPYVQNVATFGTAAIGQKIDGALHAGGNDSIVSNDFTQVISDGIGAWVTNNGRAELVSVFTYYSHIGYLSENGGRIRGTNGNNSYGDFGSVAEGFDKTETPIFCTTDNRAFNATVGNVLTDGINQLYRFEYDNAGEQYTELLWTVAGAGTQGSVEQDDFRDGGVFQVRLIDLVDDSTLAEESQDNFGGFGYVSNANTAQAGTTSQLTLAATDDEITGAYVGMKLLVTAGAGVGQVGIVDSYNAGTKIATVIKESTGASGWDHVIPGTAIVAPDASSTYIVEPRVELSGPTYSSTARTLATSLTYTDAVYAPTFNLYSPVGGNTNGSGSSASFTVVRKGVKYSAVDLVDGGSAYVRLDTITILGTNLGGTSPSNDIEIVITAVNSLTGAIQAYEFEGIGSGGRFVAISSGSRTTNTSNNGTTWTENLNSLPSTSSWTSMAAGSLTVTESAITLVAGRAYRIASLGNTNFLAIGSVANLVGTFFIATGSGTGSGTATPVANHLVAVSSSTTVNSYSTDGGITWVSGGALPGGISGTAVSISYGNTNSNGRWVVIGSGGATAFSTNGGISWTAGGNLPAGTWTSVAYGQGRWVAISTGGTATAFSTNGGASWTAGGALPASSTWVSIVYGKNKFIAVSSSGAVSPAYSVNRGVTWSNTDVAGWLNQTVTKIRYGQGVFVATNSTSNNMASSEDGLNWSSRAITRGSGTGALVAVQGNPNRNGIWAIIPSAATTAGSSAVLGAKASARSFVSDNKIFAIRIIDPGSAYTSAPTITITDSNALFEAPTQVRIGDGVCANASFINRGTGYNSAIAEQDLGDGYSDNFQTGRFIGVKRLTGVPSSGANVVFDTQPDFVYKLVTVLSQSGTFDGARGAFFQIAPDMSVFNSPGHQTDITTRIRYSQVRLTGHDFLDIGTGNFEETNYPGTPIQPAIPSRETNDLNGGRCFYTSTDQDGNFRVGELFAIEQSTGIATLNADAFNIAGLSELSLGNITLGGNSATITEFSTDPFLTANSDNVVPTQRAIRAYISAQIGGGGASLNVNSIVAGFIDIAGTRITTTTGGTIDMKANFNFQAGVRGYPVAWNYFLNN